MNAATDSIIQYRFLAPDDVPRIHRTFLHAFSDYPISQKMDQEAMCRMLTRRGVVFPVSVGAFSGDAMVAVSATGLDVWQGRETAYDIFTGVSPEHRGRGIAAGMFDHMRSSLARRGVRRFVLEVLQQNESALRAYRKIGFQVARELFCFHVDRGQVRLEAADSEVRVRRVGSADWQRWPGFWNWEPAWQNSKGSLQREPHTTVMLQAEMEERCIGYAVVVPALRDLSQLAVAREARQRGVGTRLLAAALDAVDRDPVRIINVDGSAAADRAFYASRGAEEFVRQFEMVLEL